ncbi:hypothetical protein ABZV77_11300 [Streptomyces sp. NPDC004732]|uniref:hypothetical protein n=1 Tax=Streptomyces sp. NPDC004732 TaxID=3154290 RepID=UPI00339F64A2
MATAVPENPAQPRRLGRNPRETAKIIADNAVPQVEHALQLMKIPGAVYAAGINESSEGKPEGLVHISLNSSEAYAFASWVLGRITTEEAAEHAERQEMS